MKIDKAFGRVEEMVDLLKDYDFSDIKELRDLKNLKDLLRKEEEEKKKNNTFLWIMAIIGVIVISAGIGYAIYRFLMPDYLEDFDDDFEDFDDDFFEDETDEIADWDDQPEA